MIFLLPVDIILILYLFINFFNSFIALIQSISSKLSIILSIKRYFICDVFKIIGRMYFNNIILFFSLLDNDGYGLYKVNLFILFCISNSIAKFMIIKLNLKCQDARTKKQITSKYQIRRSKRPFGTSVLDY